MNTFRNFALGAFAAAALSISSGAMAAEETLAQSAAPEIAPPKEAVALDELAELAGGAAVSVTEQDLDAVNTGNTIGGNAIAGDINVGEGAFSGFNGVGNFVVNTGHQNNLQGAVSLTVIITD